MVDGCGDETDCRAGREKATFVGEETEERRGTDGFTKSTSARVTDGHDVVK